MSKRLGTQRITTKHRAMMTMLLEGRTIGDVAREMDINTTQCSRIINSELFQQELERLRDSVREEITSRVVEHVAPAELLVALREKAEQAIAVHEELLGEADSDSVKLSAAKSVLDRVGLGTKAEVTHAGEIGLDAKIVGDLRVAMQEALGGGNTDEADDTEAADDSPVADNSVVNDANAELGPSPV